jgi:hypothetical protein
MIMIDRSRRLSEPLHWGRREKTAVAVAAVCMALAVIGLGVYALVGPSRGASAGCIDVTFASTLGGTNLHACGQRARELCASPASNPGAVADGALRASCHRARYPYGPQPPVHRD